MTLFTPSLLSCALLVASTNLASDLGAQADLRRWMTEASDGNRSWQERAQAVDSLYEHYHQAHPDEVERILTAQLQWADLADDPHIRYQAHKRKGNLMRMRGDLDGALKAYAAAETFARTLEDPILLADLANNRGNVHAARQDYVEATRQFSQALEWYDSLKNDRGKWMALTSLGSVFVLIEYYDLALKNYNEVWEALREKGIRDRTLGVVSLNLGWCHHQLGHFPAAEEFYREAMDILIAENAQIFAADCHNNWALLCKETGRYDEARRHGLEGLKLHRELGMATGVQDAQLTLAQITYLSESAAQALPEAEALQASLRDPGAPLPSAAFRRNLLHLLYKIYKDLGYPAKALEFHEQHAALKDSVAAEQQLHAVLRTAYEKDVERQMAELTLSHEIRHNELKISQLRTLIAVILAFASILGALGLFLRRIQRAHRKRRQELLLEIESLRQASMPALLPQSGQLGLDRERIERFLDRRLNETDWKVLNLLLENPTITNGELAERAFLSVDGIGSSLRRMYGYFDIQETKYKKIALLLAAMQQSRG
jgi:tetratricopeptide (TPR) repeat protein